MTDGISRLPVRERVQYNDQNVEDECGKIIAEFGNCTMNHGYERVTGKNTPACEDFETLLCTICGEHLKLKEVMIDGEKHIEWVCEGHMRKCDTCGAQEVFA